MIVPSLNLTTTVSKQFRYQIIPNFAGVWRIPFTAADIMYMLAYRSNTSALTVFSAFRLKKVQLIIGPVITGGAAIPFLGTQTQIAWDTTGTSGVDVKPADLVPMLSDGAHSSAAVLVPPAKSTLGFWQDDATGDPFFVVSGPSYSGLTAAVLILDLWVDYTLCDSQNQPQFFTPSSISSNLSQRQLTGTGGSIAQPVGWPAYSA